MKKLNRQSFLLFLADTFAMLIFSGVIGMGVEIGISGMTFAQSLRVRIVAVPINFITGRPYGIFRDWISKKNIFNFQNKYQKDIADIFAFIVFQTPIYAFNLLIAGKSTLSQAFVSIGVTVILMLIIGRPYGIFLVFCRKIFGIKNRHSSGRVTVG